MELMTDRKYQTPDLMVNIPTIERYINKKINGVIHVGADYGEETNWYRKSEIENVVWIEPLEVGFSQLKELQEKYGDKIYNCAIADYDGESEMFMVDNIVSSSLRDIGTHNQMCPLTVSGRPKVKVFKLDTLIEQEQLDMGKYNFLNVDTQGTEDLVLKGCEQNLHFFDVLYLEVNEKDVYVGCPHKDEITEYLNARNFRLLTSVKVNMLQYENIYVRN
jgi:FkbM family methyltransferase